MLLQHRVHRAGRVQGGTDGCGDCGSVWFQMWGAGRRYDR